MIFQNAEEMYQSILIDSKKYSNYALYQKDSKILMFIENEEVHDAFCSHPFDNTFILSCEDIHDDLFDWCKEYFSPNTEWTRVTYKREPVELER